MRVASRSSVVLVVASTLLPVTVLLGGCAGGVGREPRTTAAVAAPPPAAPAPIPLAAPRSPLDAAVLASATGGKPETTDDVVKVSFPRDDVTVGIDGWKAPPFMGLTSWAAFARGEKATSACQPRRKLGRKCLT